ncbi:hypothetical protein [Kribbella sp. NPDC049227]|uniref:hypothetical protein n=1 Tax=Kribbella sp. NPDC049227 TaxID=3364113 RepID=UPI00371FDF59
MIGRFRRWPEWVGTAARAWAVVYGAMACYWIAGGRQGFPIANVEGDPAGGPVAAKAIGVVLAIGCVTALVLARSVSRIAVGGLVFATATAAVGTFGLVLSAVGIVASGTIERPLALIAQSVALVGAILLSTTAQVQSRRRRSRCPRCGRHHPLPPRPESPLIRPRPRPSAPRTRRTAYLLLLLLLPWATVKSVWMFGGSALGVTATEWTATTSTSDQSWLSRELSRAGIDITVLAAIAGAALILLLLHTASVPRWILLFPAAAAAVSLTLYGVPLTIWGTLTLTGIAPTDTDPAPFTPNGLATMILFGGTAFTALGTALTIAAHSHHHRTHPTCT